MAVREGRVTFIGDDASSVRDMIGRHTRVVHARGGLVVPGFQDSHIHAPFAGRERLRLSLHGLSGRDAYMGAIAAYASTHPSEPWILGGGWAVEHFPRGVPDKEDLDSIVPDRPVFLFNQDLHGAWVNTRALEAAGIDRGTPDPLDGRIERDPVTGEASGMLHEGAAYQVDERVVPRASIAEWRSAILNAQTYLHSLGITGWQDAWVTPDTQTAYEKLAADGLLTARVVGALWWDRHRGIEQVEELLERRDRGLRIDTPMSHLGGGFHPISVKIMTDGVLENFTGALLEPYCNDCGGRTENRGLTYIDRELLAAVVTDLDRHGFQVHLHAIGDRAVRNCLDAIETALRCNGHSDRRHHIAHIQLVQPSDIRRFAELGVIANCQTFWAQSAPDRDKLTAPYLGTKRSGMQFPFADLISAGASLAMGSDWAVTTANPLEQLEVAVTRVSPDSRDQVPFLPSQRLKLDDAFDAFTEGSAHVNHDEQSGKIALGYRADLAVLDTNIFKSGFITESRAPIADAKVRLTVAAGSVVFDDGTCS
ncbi:amidohydrolase [Streptomyces sp. NBC_01142]|uniref:amidohydrolase n=1 Tax=Streptomyces sp. NBC_01142 TaxID=2975865 RepID=UPI00225C0EB7|nr:amidohydrolase [Streptomyces sp. NBC_01142]MCX4823210.1 amidohydrolase [Streptomyces sp. NBC_01142]